MTSDEIKNSTTMTEVLSMYGLRPNRKGFICCPFHKEKTPSMKIYDKSYHCFGCNESGDVFSFVQKYLDVDFKEAFEILGGNYSHDPNESLKHERRPIETDNEKETVTEPDEFRSILAQTLTVIDELIATYEPLSDEWCELQNEKPIFLYYWEYYIIDRNEVNSDDKSRILEKVSRICSKENHT